MTEQNYQAPDLNLVGAEHVRRYQETNGEVGYEWNGAHALLLTTIGRRSGEPRTNALIFARDGADYLVVASLGGAPKDPLWYGNLVANPSARIQVRDEHLSVTARTATDEERPRLWKIVSTEWPNYNVYQQRTDRKIPVVVLSTS
ncbi:nitroreductase family deazaflavin-dependent oxidoreductase [Frankia sp. AgKG'84/4]|uniref:nitroreductase family deazaflavin-dependent oxidoreductase n=1 Tax=Frankia sp. AgKG'84/4 TaxID=573490 RepID=UPI00200D18DF|nr:nitroreductase family deazaflavin-dependent oxidoreductase [Frankia sp. AgKG'84/4]MCL9793606.1 nitroreductase family deazaflavin-dependent oxidoreductase [Frankia sp. AgKG'84/4]